MDAPAGLPFQARPHDALRDGLASLREDALPRHPVETIQAAARPGPLSAANADALRHLYGAALPAKMAIEGQILARFGRLPGGVPSSHLGLEAMTGALDAFGFESYLALPADSEAPPPDLHSQMEQRLGLAAATRPLARGLH